MLLANAKVRGGPGSPGAEVVEVSLLLTAREFQQLAEAASRLGVTVGELIRRAVRGRLRGPGAGGKTIHEVA